MSVASVGLAYRYRADQSWDLSKGSTMYHQLTLGSEFMLNWIASRELGHPLLLHSTEALSEMYYIRDFVLILAAVCAAMMTMMIIDT